MSTITLQKIYQDTTKKSFLTSWKESFYENRASIICGLLTMNGNTNIYPLYQMLSENENGTTR